MNKSDSITNIAKAMHAVQKDALIALENADNPFFKTKYADLASVWNACREPLQANGLSVIQTVDVEPEGTVLETTLLHVSGEWISSRYPVTAKTQEPQSIGSAVTYARRYALAAILGVVTGDDDGEQAIGRRESTTDSPATMDAVAAVTGDGDATYKAGERTFDRAEWVKFIGNVAAKYRIETRQVAGMRHSELQQYGLEVLEAAHAAKQAQ